MMKQPNLSGNTSDSIWEYLKSTDIETGVDNPPELPDESKTVKINDVSPETRYLW